MAKVEIICDEWYPVYSIYEYNEKLAGIHPCIEIPDKLFEKYIKFENDFDDIQRELKKYYKSPNMEF